MRFIFLFVAFLSFLGASGQGATLLVPTEYSTIQEAIDAAADGDSVLVGPGFYVENIDFKGKGITVRGERGADATVIDGGLSGSVVTFKTNEGAEAVLERFTIRNGAGSDNLPYGTTGGGVFIQNASPIIRNCKIKNNRIYAGDHANTGVGGGIWAFSSESVIVGCMVCDNEVDMKGGGLACGSSNLRLVNCTIAQNTASLGGGFYCSLGSTVKITNCIAWGNQAPVGPQLVVRSASSAALDHSDVEGGQASVEVAPNSTLNWGDGLIEQDPFFVDAGNGDFHLFFDSPCQGTGSDAAVIEPFDFEGDPRISWGAVDMGADEFHEHLYIRGVKTPGGNIKAKLVGAPGKNPLALFLGSGILDPGFPCAWGLFYLTAPMITIPLIPLQIPPRGILVISAAIPSDPAAPYDIPLQALIGLGSDSLSNLEILEVR